MFNSKKIKELESKILDLEFKLDNPPEYKVGDMFEKTKEWKVIRVKFERIKLSLSDEYAVYRKWQYEVINLKTNKIKVLF